MKRIFDEYLAEHPDCEPCAAEDLDTPAALAGFVEDPDDPTLWRPVAVCEVHRVMILIAPPA